MLERETIDDQSSLSLSKLDTALIETHKEQTLHLGTELQNSPQKREETNWTDTP